MHRRRSLLLALADHHHVELDLHGCGGLRARAIARAAAAMPLLRRLDLSGCTLTPGLIRRLGESCAALEELALGARNGVGEEAGAVHGERSSLGGTPASVPSLAHADRARHLRLHAPIPLPLKTRPAQAPPSSGKTARRRCWPCCLGTTPARRRRSRRGTSWTSRPRRRPRRAGSWSYGCCAGPGRRRGLPSRRCERAPG